MGARGALGRLLKDLILADLKGRERAIVKQANVRTVSKATLGKLEMGGALMGFSERTDTILN